MSSCSSNRLFAARPVTSFRFLTASKRSSRTATHAPARKLTSGPPSASSAGSVGFGSFGCFFSCACQRSSSFLRASAPTATASPLGCATPWISTTWKWQRIGHLRSTSTVPSSPSFFLHSVKKSDSFSGSSRSFLAGISGHGAVAAFFAFFLPPPSSSSGGGVPDCGRAQTRARASTPVPAPVQGKAAGAGARTEARAGAALKRALVPH